MGGSLPLPPLSGEPSRRQLSWYLFFRVLVVTLLLGGTILYQLRGGGGWSDAALGRLYLLIGISYGAAAVSAFILRRLRRHRLFAQAQIVWDLLFVILCIYLSGGIESPLAFLFILVILSASVLLSRREVLFVASASAILYGSILDLQYYGFLPRLHGIPLAQPIDARDVFYTVFLNVLAFLLTALLGGLLVERLRRSEQALEAREIDYRELESLNRAVLANIGSGLLIVNEEGHIRAFNKGAEKITGYRLPEVYDGDVRHFFPGLAVFDGAYRMVTRGEGEFQARDGSRRILGYATSLVRGAGETPLGMLVTFQDLTRLKEMEQRLKRADRLAAVGQLASGMAHEIRNPLASISGSVQLLMEGENVTEEDRRLMRIVVREAERLSDLLTDFLLYARPPRPEPSTVDVSTLLDELAEIASADPRFARVAIRRDYSPGVTMTIDRSQIHQALWNLAINAAEAMPEGGTLWLEAEGDAGKLAIEDSGPGVSPELQDKLFNPFFTTKDRGTGLGLAMVHTIVSAHGGSVELVRGRQGGARFVLHLQPTGRD